MIFLVSAILRSKKVIKIWYLFRENHEIKQIRLKEIDPSRTNRSVTTSFLTFFPQKTCKSPFLLDHDPQKNPLFRPYGTGINLTLLDIQHYYYTTPLIKPSVYKFPIETVLSRDLLYPCCIATLLLLYNSLDKTVSMENLYIHGFIKRVVIRCTLPTSVYICA